MQNNMNRRRWEKQRKVLQHVVSSIMSDDGRFKGTKRKIRGGLKLTTPMISPKILTSHRFC